MFLTNEMRHAVVLEIRQATASCNSFEEHSDKVHEWCLKVELAYYEELKDKIASNNILLNK